VARFVACRIWRRHGECGRRYRRQPFSGQISVVFLNEKARIRAHVNRGAAGDIQTSAHNMRLREARRAGGFR